MKSALLLMLLGEYAAFGQTRPAVVDQQMASVANLPAHKIQPNDLIGLAVYDAPELTRTVRVGPDGLIDLPLLKEHIRAEGLLPGELETTIAGALKEERILIRPVVTVTIVEYHGRNVSVMGAVRKPVTFQVTGATTVMDALARAEGITNDAGPELLLVHPGQPDVRKINVNELMAGDNPGLNVLLEGGEELRVPEARKIYVVGNVKKPGAIPVRDNSQSTVLKLLAIVEGLTPYSANRAYILRNDSATGQRREIPIELKKILARKSPDLALMPDDILYIPDNSGKRDALEAAKTLGGFGTTAMSALIYAGRL
jgi:polysaccharide biosynthesis/export protein